MSWLIFIVGLVLLLLGASSEDKKHNLTSLGAEAIRLGLVLVTIGYLSLHLPLIGGNFNLTLALSLWLWASLHFIFRPNYKITSLLSRGQFHPVLEYNSSPFHRLWGRYRRPDRRFLRRSPHLSTLLPL